MRICITANGLLMRLKLNNKFVCNASAHNISSVRCHRGCHSYCVCYFGRIGLMHTVHFALHVHIWLSAYCKRNIWGLNTCTHASRNRNCISLLLLLFLLPIMIVMCQNVWVFVANDEPSKLKFGNYSDGTALMSRTWQSIAHRSQNNGHRNNSTSYALLSNQYQINSNYVEDEASTLFIEILNRVDNRRPA